MHHHTEIAGLLDEDRWARQLARAILRDTQGADDLVQEAYVRVLARSAEGAHDSATTPIARTRAWFGRVLLNLSREARRKDIARKLRERAVALDVDQEGASSTATRRGPATPDELAARAELHELLAHEVLALPQELREVVLLRHFEDLGPSAIATSLGLARSTAQDRLERAHAALRARLAHVEEHPRLGRGLALLLIPRARPAVLTVPKLLPALFTMLKPAQICVVALMLAAATVWLISSRDPKGPGADSIAALPTSDDLAREPASAGEVTSPDSTTSAARVLAVASTTDARATDGGRAIIFARVVDERGSPVEGASVDLVLTEDETREFTVEMGPGSALIQNPFQGFTDASGVATFEVPTGRALEFTGKANFRVSSTAHARLDALEGGALAEITLAVILQPDIDVAVRVVAAESGEPLANVTAYTRLIVYGKRAERPSWPPTGEPDAHGDSRGTIELRLCSWLDAGALLVAPGRTPCIVLIREASPRTGIEAPVTVRLEKSAKIEGLVEGGPTDTVVRLELPQYSLARRRAAADDASAEHWQRSDGPSHFGFETRLDTEGRFVLDGVPLGVALRPALFRRDGEIALHTQSERLVLAAGETRTVHWRVGASGAVVCTCHDPDGSPIAGESVWLWYRTPIRSSVHMEEARKSAATPTDELRALVRVAEARAQRPMLWMRILLSLTCIAATLPAVPAMLSTRARSVGHGAVHPGRVEDWNRDRRVGRGLDPRSVPVPLDAQSVSNNRSIVVADALSGRRSR